MSTFNILETININNILIIKCMNRFSQPMPLFERLPASEWLEYKIGNCDISLDNNSIEIVGEEDDIINLLKNSTVKSDLTYNLYEKHLLTVSTLTNKISENICSYNYKISNGNKSAFGIILSNDSLVFTLKYGNKIK